MNPERRFESERRTPGRHRQSTGEPDDERTEREQKDNLDIRSGACHGPSPAIIHTAASLLFRTARPSDAPPTARTISNVDLAALGGLRAAQ
jgi:hypothetical protein